jgi:hypothetical protein
MSAEYGVRIAFTLNPYSVLRTRLLHSSDLCDPCGPPASPPDLWRLYRRHP